MRKIIYSSILRTSLMVVVFLGAVGFVSAPRFALANSLPFYWANSEGGTGADESVQVAVAGTGESYVVGEYYDSGDFDPGVGTTTLTSAGNSDVYIVKYNSGFKRAN
jgi:hypothetical protein